jgi:hypothetical protein
MAIPVQPIIMGLAALREVAIMIRGWIQDSSNLPTDDEITERLIAASKTTGTFRDHHEKEFRELIDRLKEESDGEKN